MKIIDGGGNEILSHTGCVPFTTENLLDVQFGLSGNISIQVFLGNTQSSVKIKFAILKNKKSSQQLPSCVFVTRDSLFCKMFSLLFFFEQEKTVKNFSKKLYTRKKKKKLR